jgi:AcrR family transcriptional regulator
MPAAHPAADGRLDETPRSAAQNRVLDAAMELIGDHGVGGTSLQMIADAIGVTKAAVYHQFNTKNEIVIAMTERELATLKDPVAAAEAEPDRERARTLLLARVIDVAVARRRWISTLTNDPVIVRLLGQHPPFIAFISRLYGVLLDERDDTEARVAAAVMSAAIAGSVINPLVADIDDDTLRTSLTSITARVLDLPR